MPARLHVNRTPCQFKNTWERQNVVWGLFGCLYGQSDSLPLHEHLRRGIRTLHWQVPLLWQRPAQLEQQA